MPYKYVPGVTRAGSRRYGIKDFIDEQKPYVFNPCYPTCDKKQQEPQSTESRTNEDGITKCILQQERKNDRVAPLQRRMNSAFTIVSIPASKGQSPLFKTNVLRPVLWSPVLKSYEPPLPNSVTTNMSPVAMHVNIIDLHHKLDEPVKPVQCSIPVTPTVGKRASSIRVSVIRRT